MAALRMSCGMDSIRHKVNCCGRSCSASSELRPTTWKHSCLFSFCSCSLSPLPSTCGSEVIALWYCLTLLRPVGCCVSFSDWFGIGRDIHSVKNLDAAVYKVSTWAYWLTWVYLENDCLRVVLATCVVLISDMMNKSTLSLFVLTAIFQVNLG